MEIQKDIKTLEKHGVYTLQYNVMQLPVRGEGGGLKKNNKGQERKE